jgi:hypothetical protein
MENGALTRSHPQPVMSAGGHRSPSPGRDGDEQRDVADHGKVHGGRDEEAPLLSFASSSDRQRDSRILRCPVQKITHAGATHIPAFEGSSATDADR